MKIRNTAEITTVSTLDWTQWVDCDGGTTKDRYFPKGEVGQGGDGWLGRMRCERGGLMLLEAI